MDGSTALGRAGGQGGFEPTPQIIDMASTEELLEAIYRLIASSPTPIPVTLMNDGVDETAAIIGALVERQTPRQIVTGQAIALRVHRNGDAHVALGRVADDGVAERGRDGNAELVIDKLQRRSCVNPTSHAQAALKTHAFPRSRR